jgi:hypothetical protein
MAATPVDLADLLEELTSGERGEGKEATEGEKMTGVRIRKRMID